MTSSPHTTSPEDEESRAGRMIAAGRRWMTKTLGRPERLLACTFLLLILIGVSLLTLPIAQEGQKVGVLDALFTATSAVCVTGLVVADTGRDFTPFGQGVLLVLIQLGGLGIMTFAALAAQLLGRRLSFRSQAVLHDAFYQREAAGDLRHNLKRIASITLVLEGAGACILYGDFRDHSAGQPPLFSALFHSVSAFCNAGFSLYSDSLIAFRSHRLTMVTMMILIILGGLGHTVVLELIGRPVRRLLGRKSGPVPWSLNSRVVMRVSLGLIVLGACGFMLLGLGSQGDGWTQVVTDGLFQSVTARTAGFNTLSIGTLPTASLILLACLMLVGGSPGSCAGGIKTTSLAIYYAYFRSRLRAAKDVALFGRRLPEDLVARAAVIGGLALLWNVSGCVLLAAQEPLGSGVRFEDLLFEQVSAFATVGLSTGITPTLTAVSKIWLIITMFVGRLGPLTAAFLVVPQQPVGIRFPEERLMVG